MKRESTPFILSALLALVMLLPIRDSQAEDVVRPEEIRSKREVIYDQATYEKLADLWEKYYHKFPSEFSYANWMYAARYAGSEDYWKLLKKGLKKYPANPMLLYLASMEKHGESGWELGLEYLEKATTIDPGYTDPWFSLVVEYMRKGDDERLNLALRKLLESGVITDDVMDFNYNMLISMEPNGILVTNGDNDTYPGLILTRILNVQPGVTIANRSLLNTDWYPNYLIERGAPRFITPDELTALRDSTFKAMKDQKPSMTPGGPFGDTLIVRIVDAATREGRPVYLSHTLYDSPTTKRLRENGRDLGLISLVTPSKQSYGEQLGNLFSKWLSDFRTGGLDSWRLRQSKSSDAGRMLMPNYGYAIAIALDSLAQYAPNLRTGLFQWYRLHADPLLPEKMKSQLGSVWCQQKDMEVVQKWCKEQGYTP